MLISINNHVLLTTKLYNNVYYNISKQNQFYYWGLRRVYIIYLYIYYIGTDYISIVLYCYVKIDYVV